MSMRSWRIDVGADGPVAERGLSRELYARPSGGEGEGSVESGGGPVAHERGLRRWWSLALRISRGAWAEGFGGGRRRFEEALHQFARELDGVASPADIEAGLLSLTRSLVPDKRIALIRTPDEVAGPCPGSDGEGLSDRTGHPVHDPGRWRGESMTELPLRCGGVVHGRLQLIHTRTRLALRPVVLRRLAIACTMAACAMEHLRQQAEWGWKAVDETGDEGRSLANQAKPPGVIGDATFLNAVFPFALGQAKRHREPISLLCLAIDRLSAIRDLLGPDAVDHLAREVCQIVASSIRRSDIVARLDDNRIVVMLIRARARNALHVAQKISRSINERTRNVAELGCATVSIGVAEFPGDAAKCILAPGRGRRCPRPRPARGTKSGRTRRGHATPDRGVPRLRSIRFLHLLSLCPAFRYDDSGERSIELRHKADRYQPGGLTVPTCTREGRSRVHPLVGYALNREDR